MSRSLLDAGVARVAVVAGAHPEAVRAAVEPGPEIQVVHHGGWAAGQLSSLLAGLDAVDDPALEAIAVTLVDVPLVRVATVRLLLDAWRQSGAPVVRPAIGDRTVTRSSSTAPPSRRCAPRRSTSVPRRSSPPVAPRVLNVPTDDAGVLRDVDTPAEYAALLDGQRRAGG